MSDPRHIGDSIQEAIDWTQDRLGTTRPMAERTLFSLLADHKARETSEGFFLYETDEEVEKRYRKTKHTVMTRTRKFRFHSKRAQRHQQHHQQHNQHTIKKLDHSDAADDMLEESEEE